METRFILRPGQPGTRKLVEKYGELKTVELVVESVIEIASGWGSSIGSWGWFNLRMDSFEQPEKLPSSR
jgi:hypothetical protein